MADRRLKCVERSLDPNFKHQLWFGIKKFGTVHKREMGNCVHADRRSINGVGVAHVTLNELNVVGNVGQSPWISA